MSSHLYREYAVGIDGGLDGLSDTAGRCLVVQRGTRTAAHVVSCGGESGIERETD